MAESKPSMQIPEQVKEMVEKAIEQAEQGVYRLIEAADKSASIVPNPTTDFSKKLLSMGAQNMNAAFDHARNLLRYIDLAGSCKSSSAVPECAVRDGKSPTERTLWHTRC